jgi:hypothetical protein
VRLALADHFALLLAAGLAVDLGALVFVLGAQGQAFDALGGVDRGGGEAGEGLQGIEFDRFETVPDRGRRGSAGPRTFIDEQRAAHAVMHFQVIAQPSTRPS